ncbi:hypothetical protein [Nostoc sp.]|uniref:hypothetical protein n=1 Tax=Nostoc sp. TaxID=1180 RepID=UPI002FF52ABB
MGHGALGIGHWAWGIGHGALVINSSPPLPLSINNFLWYDSKLMRIWRNWQTR